MFDIYNNKQRRASIITPFNILMVIMIYVSISLMVYRFKHPEQTETQLFLNVPNAVLWRD